MLRPRGNRARYVCCAMRGTSAERDVIVGRPDPDRGCRDGYTVAYRFRGRAEQRRPEPAHIRTLDITLIGRSDELIGNADPPMIVTSSGRPISALL